MKIFIKLLAIGFVIIFSYVPTVVAKDFVAILLPENVNPRWESQDAAFYVKHMKKFAPNIKVEVFNANKIY